MYGPGRSVFPPDRRPRPRSRPQSLPAGVGPCLQQNPHTNRCDGSTRRGGTDPRGSRSQHGFHSVKSGFKSVSCCDPVLFDDSGDLFSRESTRRDERLTTLIGVRLTFRPNCRRGHGKCAVRLQRGMGNSSHMQSWRKMRPYRRCTASVTLFQPFTCSRV